jgi:hypothetical protein
VNSNDLFKSFRSVPEEKGSLLKSVVNILIGPFLTIPIFINNASTSKGEMRKTQFKNDKEKLDM